MKTACMNEFKRAKTSEGDKRLLGLASLSQAGHGNQVLWVLVASPHPQCLI